MFLSSLPGTNRNIKQHSVITAWQLPVKLAAGYWVPTETWNNTQLLLRGNYLLYWMMLTGYPQKHETALSYYHVAITCYTGCCLLGIHRNMKQHSVITTWQLPVILDAAYWVSTKTWNSTQLLPRGNYLLYWMLVTRHPQNMTATQVILFKKEGGK